MEFKELWPLPWPPIVVVTGPYGCGKSTFALSTGAEMSRTTVYDFEKSQESFEKQLHFDYHDVAAMMNAKYPTGYPMQSLYQEIVTSIDAIPTGKFDILILDNASPLEEAHAAEIDKNPTKYGLTANQINSSGGLKWGSVKNLYFQNIIRWSSKFSMIFIIVQLADKWSGNSPVKDEFGNTVQKPKGKETLDMLSSLFVWLEPGPGGVPAANVVKCRIDKKIYVPDPSTEKDIPEVYLNTLGGEPGVVSIPVLPLRLPKCRWKEIREYMRKPADLFNPAPGEALSKKAMSDDDRLRVRAQIAQNEAAIAEQERVKREAAAALELENKKRMFVNDAANLGYKTPDGKPDIERIKAVLTPLGFYPYSRETDADARKALKEGMNGK
jgi:hypothetical protein